MIVYKVCRLVTINNVTRAFSFSHEYETHPYSKRLVIKYQKQTTFIHSYGLFVFETIADTYSFIQNYGEKGDVYGVFKARADHAAPIVPNDYKVFPLGTLVTPSLELLDLIMMKGFTDWYLPSTHANGKGELFRIEDIGTARMRSVPYSNLRLIMSYMHIVSNEKDKF